MASVNFNNAATSALRNLQATNTQLDATQGRISTGLKIGQAKDNAAYWSISTTLKSDNKALSTVSDALGLGSATVDTAYQGLTKALDVLNELKSKITAASQDGVDKKAVQDEISQLQSQLKSIAGASALSGENWLSVNSSLADYDPAKSIVSGFNRSESGNVTLSTISIDTSTFALVDNNTGGEGILDAGKTGNTLRGGLDSAAAATVGLATAGTSTAAAAFAFVAGSGAGYNPATQTLALTVLVDGTNSISFTLTDSTKFDTLDELVTQINQQLGSAATASNAAGSLVITSNTKSATSAVDITTATFTSNGATPSTLAGVTAGDTAAPGTSTGAIVTMASNFGTAPITLDKNDVISFEIAVNGAEKKTVTIDRATINSALSVTDGEITTANEYATVLTKALANAGVGGVTVDLAGTAVRFTSTILGENSKIHISSVDANKGQGILDIDVTNADQTDLTAYLNAVSSAITKVTAAASTIGAIASRVDLQKDFVTTLMDTIDKGVSGLIDADMNEESTKLQALQVKQQLGVQALSIANQSAQNVLALFQ